MQWRKAAAMGGAALGAAALYNAASSLRVEPLLNPVGGEDGEILWRGHRIAYSRQGEGRPVLLVHGIYAGASSFEWRHIVPALAERHTVITFDLLGFGRSDRPATRYTPGLYQALVGDVIARVVREPCAVIASALSAAHVIALAARDPRNIAALALIAPTGVAPRRAADPAGGPASRLLLNAPIIGNTMYNGLTSPASMQRYLESVYAEDRLVTPALVNSYVRAARQPGGRHAVVAFLRGHLELDVRTALRRLRQPTLLLWGDLARNNPVDQAHAFRVLKRDAEWALIQEAGDLPHAERAAEVDGALRTFFERTGGWVSIPRPRLATA